MNLLKNVLLMSVGVTSLAYGIDPETDKNVQKSTKETEILSYTTGGITTKGYEKFTLTYNTSGIGNFVGLVQKIRSVSKGKFRGRDYLEEDALEFEVQSKFATGSIEDAVSLGEDFQKNTKSLRILAKKNIEEHILKSNLPNKKFLLENLTAGKIKISRIGESDGLHVINSNGEYEYQLYVAKYTTQEKKGSKNTMSVSILMELANEVGSGDVGADTLYAHQLFEHRFPEQLRE